MTWAPRNKSEDEDDDEGDGARSKEESPEKMPESNETSAEDEGGRGVTAGARRRRGGPLPSRPIPPRPPESWQMGGGGRAGF